VFRVARQMVRNSPALVTRLDGSSSGMARIVDEQTGSFTR
jgi:hypothetical protein